MKKVVLLGDSIRMIGYGPLVPALLGSEYTVWQPEDNCRFVKYTLRGLFEWRDDIAGADIIHWNNGLWDTSTGLFPDGGKPFTDEAEYVNNMLRVAAELKKIAPRVIFATTTPVRPDYEYNDNGVIARYNSVADSIYGEFVRRDAPLLSPRSGACWDRTVTTNPAAAILPSGKTCLIYKSRRGAGQPLMLGCAAADRPDGEFLRLSDAPVLTFDDPDLHVEDPFLWYDAAREKFCLLAKDDSKNGSAGITGEWGSGFYAESDDCVHFKIPSSAKIYSRRIQWKNGEKSVQGNMERPWILFDETGRPEYLFCASGAGSNPYSFEGRTFIIAQELVPDP